ncbi:hypothetical protein Tdes44962_MAKER06808 [Teratosphaeria destructans]|uniref:Uncharacterized protein n=1 Tax=Teratosphaeria destructans TaxID=418781 RepID=A0A9W7W6K0_9PEZI|nr:hypothetical protein Tdes44962_MAKER06808 [Teratosphaeria destructans]
MTTAIPPAHNRMLSLSQGENYHGSPRCGIIKVLVKGNAQIVTGRQLQSCSASSWTLGKTTLDARRQDLESQ